MVGGVKGFNKVNKKDIAGLSMLFYSLECRFESKCSVGASFVEETAALFVDAVFGDVLGKFECDH